jgi:hypothetical protein
MKQVIWKNGLISGALITTFTLISMYFCYTSETMQGNMLLGFTAMFLAFAFIFVGVKNFRDKHNEGVVTFGKAFMVGLYIALISSSMYVIGWMFEYHLVMPDFMDKYVDYGIQHIDKASLSAEEYDKQVKGLESYRHTYDNKISMALLTYMEILPVGMLMSLIAALVFMRKKKEVS